MPILLIVFIYYISASNFSVSISVLVLTKDFPKIISFLIRHFDEISGEKFFFNKNYENVLTFKYKFVDHSKFTES